MWNYKEYFFINMNNKYIKLFNYNFFYN
jgi:hypothetical protein